KPPRPAAALTGRASSSSALRNALPSLLRAIPHGIAVGGLGGYRLAVPIRLPSSPLISGARSPPASCAPASAVARDRPVPLFRGPVCRFDAAGTWGRARG